MEKNNTTKISNKKNKAEIKEYLLPVTVIILNSIKKTRLNPTQEGQPV